MSLPHLDYKWLSKHFLQRGQVFLHTPDFHLAVMRGVDMQCHMVRIDRTQTCALDEASMATIQILCQAEQRTRDGYNLLGALIQSREYRTFFAWQNLAMIQCRCCHNGNFCQVKAWEVRMFDQVAGVRLVISVGQKRPDVMQQGSIFEQFAFPCPETVQASVARAIEQRQGQVRGGAGMSFVKLAGPSQVPHTARAY